MGRTSNRRRARSPERGRAKARYSVLELMLAGLGGLILLVVAGMIVTAMLKG
jgi:hypothetical protein